MFANLSEPRDAGVVDMESLHGVEFMNVADNASCIETCVTGYTILCDGRTF